MICFKRLRYCNFLSTGSIFTEIDLSATPTTLIVGMNGSGKSTFIDALCYVLYNKPFRNINKPKLINSIIQKNLLVEIEFEINDVEYLVRRGQKPNLFEIHRDGKLIDQTTGILEYQDILEKQILKMSYKSFIQIVILGSTNYVPFMRLAAQGRREVIEDLLDIEIFSIMNSLLKEKEKTNRENFRNVEANVSICEHKLELNKKHLQIVEEHHEAYVANRNKLQEGYKTTKINLGEELKQIKKERTSVYDWYVVLEKKREDLALWGNLLSGIKDNLKRKQEALDFFLKETHCSQCGHQMDDTTRNRMREPKEKNIKELENAIIELKVKIDKSGFSPSDYRLVLNKLNDLTFKEGGIEQKINTLSLLIQQGETDLIRFQERVKSLDEQTDQTELLQQELLFLSQEKAKLLEEREILDVSSILLKDGGIKTKIVQQYIPVMNEFINKYLEAMDLFVSFCLDDSFNETIKSRFRDEFTYECLPASTQIETENGLKTIKWIIDNDYHGKVLTLSKEGNFVWNKVLKSWSKKNKNKKWVMLKIDGNCKGTKKHLVCTHDHRVQVISEPLDPKLDYIQAENSVGKWSIRVPGFRDNAIYNKEQLSVLFGTLMGDGSINNEGQLRNAHKTEHKEYIEIKKKILGGSIINKITNSFGKRHEISILDSGVNGQTKFLRKLLYNKKKSISNIIQLLDEISLAFWYMDDGCLHWPSKNKKWRPYITLCTDSFTHEECVKLQEMFLEKWNIAVSVKSYKNKFWRINLNCNETENFLKIVAPFITSTCMEYKLTPNLRGKKRFNFDTKRKDYAISEITSLKYHEYNWKIPATRKYSSRLYDMEIANSHNFIANKTVVHNSFSEGEKLRINLAILFAWLEIAKLRNSSSCNLLIMDEILDGSLDLEGADALFKLIQDISKNRNIFVISHKWNMQDKFNRVLEFKKSKNFSRIVT